MTRLHLADRSPLHPFRQILKADFPLSLESLPEEH